jgi:hypothetical protein
MITPPSSVNGNRFDDSPSAKHKAEKLRTERTPRRPVFCVRTLPTYTHKTCRLQRREQPKTIFPEFFPETRVYPFFRAGSYVFLNNLLILFMKINRKERAA